MFEKLIVIVSYRPCDLVMSAHSFCRAITECIKSVRLVQSKT